MKKIVLSASLILTLGACTPSTTPLVKTPENFMELMEGVQALGNDVSYTITSDSAGYSEYYDTHFFHKDPEDIRKMHDFTVTIDSVKGTKKDYREVGDSIIEHEETINNYIKDNVKALIEKYAPTAVKCYQYDTHIDGKDTTQYIIALQEVEDTIPEWAEKEGFSESFRWYPEFFRYDCHSTDNSETFTWMTYHKEATVVGKAETTPEETERLVHDFIAKQKNVKQKARKYAIDEGFAMGEEDYNCVSFSRAMQKTDSMLINATHYIIPVLGEERRKVADDLWSLFSNHVKNHYSKVHGHWGFECVKHNEISDDIHQIDPQLLQMSIAKDEDGKMLHFQVGIDSRGLHILVMHIETRRFYIPGNWLYIDSIHNKDVVDDMDFGKSEKSDM
ncbi:MAG: hypothetical protein IJP82_09285 [Bacteroidaceae bacterium]|nr:hypothetical protein [Bacteroidaceae bacterium]